MFRIMIFFLPCFVLGQTGITGQATVTLVEADAVCGDAGRRVHLFADVEHIQGSGGELVGINSFVATFSLDRPVAFTMAFAGDDPVLDWGCIHTRRSLVQVSGQVVVAGWVPATDAPNQNYHLATLILAGDAGPVSLSVTSLDLASRVVNQQSPEAILVTLPGSLSVTLPVDFTLNMPEGASYWLDSGGPYDLNNSSGVDMLDFVSVINCGGGS